MVRAAYDLFSVHGYAGTTISAIAQEAGVAIPTVYYTFGTKAALLEESLGAAIVGFDQWRIPPPQPQVDELLSAHGWWRDFESSPTSHAAFDIFFTHGIGILERVAPLVATLHGASGLPETAEILKTSEQRRVEVYRAAVRVMAGKPGGLRSGLTSATATDILVVVFSAEFYRSIRAGRGWSARRTAGLLRELLAAQMLPD
jgi:AcrR family transcriptional regulator